MSIYREVEGSKANRIEGRVGSVPNSRRIRPAVKSARPSGGVFNAPYPIGQAKLTFKRSKKSSRRSYR